MVGFAGGRCCRAAALYRGHRRSISAALRAAPTELRLRRISALPGNDRLP